MFEANKYELQPEFNIYCHPLQTLELIL